MAEQTAPSRIDAITGLVKALAWPAIALIGLALFYAPIARTLNSLSRESDQIEDIRLGAIELKIRPSELPSSSREVAASLSGLQEKEVVMLLEINAQTGYGYCRSSDPREDFQGHAGEAIDDLGRRGLISVEIRVQSDPHCVEEHYTHLTPNGANARAFLLNLVSAQLKTATVAPASP